MFKFYIDFESAQIIIRALKEFEMWFRTIRIGSHKFEVSFQSKG